MSNACEFPIPVIGFAAYSGTGKTTLLEQLIPWLTEQGLNIGLVKHSHHDIEMDKPGKDSYRLRKAGATQLVLAGTERAILFSEYTEKGERQLTQQLALLQTESLDLVLVEGFRDQVFTKIELHRQGLNKPFLFTEDPSIVALACDGQVTECDLPILDINDVAAIGMFILQLIKVQ